MANGLLCLISGHDTEEVKWSSHALRRDRVGGETESKVNDSPWDRNQEVWRQPKALSGAKPPYESRSESHPLPYTPLPRGSRDARNHKVSGSGSVTPFGPQTSVYGAKDRSMSREHLTEAALHGFEDRKSSPPVPTLSNMSPAWKPQSLGARGNYSRGELP
ncbi:putative leucine-rich repeat-containing protein C10orf11 -like [Scophthalmus maximus]|uniref:Putative leucine-rich repeat-containing protein C10orf11-like n=1 Tax=Scophthalmus maximus TaxID=52904 RepID=A0A2U9CDZ2_SCOMX|nr:putative leucine-rich repeat-containing protein C10orf11 -like [Scophthalmus maximus]